MEFEYCMNHAWDGAATSRKHLFLQDPWIFLQLQLRTEAP